MLAYSPSSTSLWDSSPIIAEVLRQISQSKAAVHELRTQLSDFRAGAAEARTSIQGELEAQRERKREEDGARAELKARTKTLEDSKRSAEGSRRDVEKRLRAAESARDSAAARIERLGEEIGALRGRMQDDEEIARRCKEEGDAQELETQEVLERKRKEIKVAEDVVAALNARAKELEEKIVQEEERLRRAKEEAEIKKQDRSFFPLTVVPTVNEEDVAIPPWPTYPDGQETTYDPLTHDSVATIDRQEPFSPPIQAPRSKGSQSSGSGSGDYREVSVSPRPARLSLTGISNLREPPNRVLAEPDPNGQVLLRPNGFPLFGGELPSTLSTRSTSSRFSPFGDSDDADAPRTGDGFSPLSVSYIPAGLINSLDGAGAADTAVLARSFQSEDDAVLARDWRKSAPFAAEAVGAGLYTTSPASLTCPAFFDGPDREDAFEVRPRPARRRLTGERMDRQRVAFPDPAPAPVRAGSDPQGGEDRGAPPAQHRRWVSQQEPSREQRRGLNPEAKAFSLTKKSFPPLFSASASAPAPPFDFDHRAFTTGNGNGVGSLPSLSGSASSLSSISVPEPAAPADPGVGPGAGLFSALSMRAFAPSREEREALQRALGGGGSSNASLERLPTLSEVSLPSSPAHVHAAAVAAVAPAAGAGAGAFGRARLPNPNQALAWLSLPRVRKPKFSPWEDEETPAGSAKELEAGGSSGPL